MTVFKIFLQLKKIWRRWKIWYCKRPSPFLPKHQEYTQKSYSCRFIRGFYCISDSFIVTLCAVILAVILILFLQGITVSDVLYQVGWGPPAAVISTSILDVLEDANFPEDDSFISLVKSDRNNITASSARANIDNAIVWKVDGFTEYIEKFADDPGALGIFAKLPSGKKLDKSGYGFWAYRFGSQENVGQVGNFHNASSDTPSISALRISSHLQTSPEDVEVAVSIRAYVDGEATIVVKYESSLSKEMHVVQLKPDVFKNKGFCHKILDIPFKKKIDSIQIRPTSTNLRRNGIVVVDHVLIVVAKGNVAESIIHTLVPNQWC